MGKKKGIDSFPLMLLEFVLDAAPSLECDTALVIFYPAFSQVSCEIKDENAGFFGVVGEDRAGNVPALSCL